MLDYRSVQATNFPYPWLINHVLTRKEICFTNPSPLQPSFSITGCAPPASHIEASFPPPIDPPCCNVKGEKRWIFRDPFVQRLIYNKWPKTQRNSADTHWTHQNPWQFFVTFLGWWNRKYETPLNCRNDPGCCWGRSWFCLGHRPPLWNCCLPLPQPGESNLDEGDWISSMP